VEKILREMGDSRFKIRHLQAAVSRHVMIEQLILDEATHESMFA